VPQLTSELRNRDTSVTNDREPTPARKIHKVAIIAVKLLVTGACFWYLSWQIDFRGVFSSLPQLDLRWAAFAALLVVLQIPLVAARWREVLHVLSVIDRRMTNTSIVAITAIGVFFAQVLPSMMGDGIRAWLIVRLGCDWRNAVTSVVIDRGIGAGMLIALGFVILLLPSGFSALGGYRDLVLMLYGALLAAGAVVLWLLPTLVLRLGRTPYLRWLAALASDARRVILGRKGAAILLLAGLVHALTIVIVWLLGRALGWTLPISDAAVLFVVVIGVGLVPVSINGWGLRELAVVALLGGHGVAPEQALVFSVCFGLVLAVGSLPGALAWLVYSAAPAKRPIECSR
jgi:glycosyltransferase 2 family protein